MVDYKLCDEINSFSLKLPFILYKVEVENMVIVEINTHLRIYFIY